MKKIICDKCRKEITGNPVKIIFEEVDRNTEDYCEGTLHTDLACIDLCVTCKDALADMVRKFCGIKAQRKPAVINQEFESAVQDMIATSQQEKDPPPTDKPKRRLDTGKIMALRNAGWSVKAISEEMNCSEQGIYNVLNKKKAPEQKPTEQSNDN